MPFTPIMNSNIRRPRTAGLLLLPYLLLTVRSTRAQSSSSVPKLQPVQCESEMALSAAPEHLRADASVFVLEKDGYVLKSVGAKGITCIVNRDHPRVLKPVCFDEAGSDSIVPMILHHG